MNTNNSGSSSLESDLRTWAQLDNKIRAATAELKTLRTNRDEIGTRVCDTMKQRGIENKKIDTGDSVITLYEKNDYSSLTYGYVEKCLGEIITDKEHVAHIMNYLKSKREVKKSTDLRRTFKKDT
jgi:hypothetical protein